MPNSPLDIFTTGGEPLRRNALRPYDIVATLAALCDDKGLVLTYLDGEAHLDLSAHSAVAPLGGGHSLRTLVALEVFEHLFLSGGGLVDAINDYDGAVRVGSILIILTDCAYAAKLFAAGEVAA